MSYQKGLWLNGKQKQTGEWKYFWGSDKFIIWLDSVDRITGRQRQVEVHGEKPEWGNWKLQNDDAS